MTTYHNNQLSKRLIQDAAKHGISEDLIQKNLSKGKLLNVKKMRYF